GTSWQHRDDRGEAGALREKHPHARRARFRMVDILLVLRGAQIGAVRIQRLQQAAYGPVGHLLQVRLGDVVALDAVQDLAIHTQVLVGLFIVGGWGVAPAQDPAEDDVKNQDAGNRDQRQAYTIAHLGSRLLRKILKLALRNAV